MHESSSGSGFGNPKCHGGSNDIKFMDQLAMVRGECTSTATTKADLELLAKNRGNAMQRYMEKKKTRRFGVQFLYGFIVFLYHSLELFL